MIIPSYSIISEDKTKRSFTSYAFAGLSIVKSDFNPGYWYVMDYPERVDTKSMTAIHVVVSGGVYETTHTLPDRTQGWISTTDSRAIEAGQYRRETPEGCVMWCIRSANPNDLSVAHVHVVGLESGETVSVPPNSNLFVAEGTCLMGTRELAREKHYQIGAEARTLTASSKAYLFYWPTPPQ
jgi:hypothetical protein